MRRGTQEWTKKNFFKVNTTPKMKFFIKDFFSECDQMDWFIYDRNYRNETVKAKNDNNEHLLQIVFKRKTVR